MLGAQPGSAAWLTAQILVVRVVIGERRPGKARHAVVADVRLVHLLGVDGPDEGLRHILGLQHPRVEKVGRVVLGEEGLRRARRVPWLLEPGLGEAVRRRAYVDLLEGEILDVVRLGAPLFEDNLRARGQTAAAEKRCGKARGRARRVGGLHCGTKVVWLSFWVRSHPEREPKRHERPDVAAVGRLDVAVLVDAPLPDGFADVLRTVLRRHETVDSVCALCDGWTLWRRESTCRALKSVGLPLTLIPLLKANKS